MTDYTVVETLLRDHEPINLIDVRSKGEFARMHIPGARSLPFDELVAPEIFRRRRPTTERIYVISRTRARASLATGILRASGCTDAVTVDGGMEAWIAHGFPVRRERAFRSRAMVCGAGAVMTGLATGVALAVHELLIAAILVVMMAAMVIKSDFFARKDRTA